MEGGFGVSRPQSWRPSLDAQIALQWTLLPRGQKAKDILCPLLPSMREGGFQFSETALSSVGLFSIYPHWQKERETGHRRCKSCPLPVAKAQVGMTAESQERASGQMQHGIRRV